MTVSFVFFASPLKLGLLVHIRPVVLVPYIIHSAEGQDAMPHQTVLLSAEFGGRKSLAQEIHVDIVAFRQLEDCWRGVSNSHC